MPNPIETPVDELSGRPLDAAVHEEVFGGRPFAVTGGDLEAKLSMSGIMDDDPLRNAYCAEAMEYPEDQRSIGCPRYSSGISEAREVDEFMRTRPDAMTKFYYMELRSRGLPASLERGLGETAHEIEDSPELICRAALQAVREEAQ